MDEIQEIMNKLDLYQPNWFISWADTTDLRDYARGGINKEGLRHRQQDKVIAISHAMAACGWRKV